MRMFSVRLLSGLIASLWLLHAAELQAAQANSLVGTWQGSTPVKGMTPIVIDLMFSSDGRFAERTKYNGRKSIAFGTYKIVSKNMVRLQFTEWEHKPECMRLRCDHVVQ